jgi:hypothetical protein
MIGPQALEGNSKESSQSRGISKEAPSILCYIELAPLQDFWTLPDPVSHVTCMQSTG